MKITEGVSLISNFLSPEECQSFIRTSEQEGYKEATVSLPGKPTMMKNIRDNDRVIFESEELATSLFSRIQPYIREALDDAEPHSLNPRFRYYRYSPGQKFKRHIDGSEKVGDLESKVTFLMYLNEDCEGGETIFRPKGIPVGGEGEYKIPPELGSALLFQHQLWHEGAPLISGSKYVLRTDIFYQIEQ